MDNDQNEGWDPDAIEEFDEYRSGPPTWARAVAIVVILGLVGLYALRPSRNASVAPVGPFELVGLRDSDPNLTNADLAGRPLVINLWASWCVPCRTEMPRIEKAWQTYRSEGLLIIGVDVMDAPSNALEFLDEIGVSYPVVTDPGDVLIDSLQQQGLPQTLFIPPAEGALDAALSGDYSAATLVLGDLTVERLDAEIRKILRSVAR